MYLKNALAQTAKLKADLLSKANVEYDIKVFPYYFLCLNLCAPFSCIKT